MNKVYIIRQRSKHYTEERMMITKTAHEKINQRIKMMYLSRKDHDELMDNDLSFLKFLMSLPHKWCLAGVYWEVQS